MHACAGSNISLVYRWESSGLVVSNGVAAAAEAELSTLVNFIWRMAVESLVRRRRWSVGLSLLKGKCVAATSVVAAQAEARLGSSHLPFQMEVNLFPIIALLYYSRTYQ